MRLTKREQELNSAKRFESFDDYKAEVLSRACKLRPGSLCVDTVWPSYQEGKSLDEAARAVVDDSIYWEGGYG